MKKKRLLKIIILKRNYRIFQIFLNNYYDSESGGNVDFIIQNEFQSLFQ